MYKCGLEKVVVAMALISFTDLVDVCLLFESLFLIDELDHKVDKQACDGGDDELTGTVDSPIEISSVTEFKVELDPQREIYYNLYKLQADALKNVGIEA